jgi:hypothetical protein
MYTSLLKNQGAMEFMTPVFFMLLSAVLLVSLPSLLHALLRTHPISSVLKGQGATEYIVVLAIVLTVALVVVGLLGFFPGFSGDTQASESAAYWGATRPMSIQNSLQYVPGTSTLQNLSIVVENHAPTSITVTLVNITSLANGSSAWNSTSVSFAPGERNTMIIYNTSAAATSVLYDCVGRSGKTNTYNVTFVYNQDPLTGKKQIGSKPLVVQCGP